MLKVHADLFGAKRQVKDDATQNNILNAVFKLENLYPQTKAIKDTKLNKQILAVEIRSSELLMQIAEKKLSKKNDAKKIYSYYIANKHLIEAKSQFKQNNFATCFIYLQTVLFLLGEI